MALLASDIDRMIEGGESVHRIVRELILALGRRDDAGDKEDGDKLASILSDLHGRR